MKPRSILLLVGSLGCLFMLGFGIAGIILLTRIPLVRHMTVAEECEVTLPQKSGTIVYRRIGLHPFQAEYSHSVRLAEASTSHPLLRDTGAAGHLNVYGITSAGRTFLRLEDAMGEYLWDLQNDVLYLVIRAGDRAFVAPFQSEYADELITIWDHNPQQIEVSVDGRPGVALEKIVGNGQETYLGAIFGQANQLQFHDAASCPEQPIQ